MYAVWRHYISGKKGPFNPEVIEALGPEEAIETYLKIKGRAIDTPMAELHFVVCPIRGQKVAVISRKPKPQYEYTTVEYLDMEDDGRF
jgi:hypothetical protein